MVEEPLEIRLNGRPITVTMRTPDSDIELAQGFLLTEGVIAHRDDVLTVLQAVGASDDQEVPVPTGAVLVDVGGVRFWSFGAP